MRKIQKLFRSRYLTLHKIIQLALDTEKGNCIFIHILV